MVGPHVYRNDGRVLREWVDMDTRKVIGRKAESLHELSSSARVCFRVSREQSQRTPLAVSVGLSPSHNPMPLERLLASVSPTMDR